jgi:putrescine transport system substrate-binding protein
MIKWVLTLGVMCISTLQAQEVLNLCSWWGMFPPELIKEFEQETGIQVVQDFMDSNEILEAKLLAGRTGYDLVTPSFLPYGARQIQTGLYAKLNKASIGQEKQLDPWLLSLMEPLDPHNAYAIPVVWGTVGLAYNEEKLKALYPKAPFNSWRLIFDPEIARHFASCRISILEEPSDILIPAALSYGWAAPFRKPEDLHLLKEKLLDIRPFISRFDSIRSSDDLMNGSLCLVMQWTGGIEYARHNSASSQKNAIKTLIPEEGSVLWIDTLMIPSDAPHPKAAHAFIRFILRPQNMAHITNKTFYANSVPASLPWVHKTIKEHPALYPPLSMKQKLVLNTLEAPPMARALNRVITHFKKGRS